MERKDVKYIASNGTVFFFVFVFVFVFVFFLPIRQRFPCLPCNSRLKESIFWRFTYTDSQVGDPIQEMSSFLEVHLARLDAVSTKHILNTTRL